MQKLKAQSGGEIGEQLKGIMEKGRHDPSVRAPEGGFWNGGEEGAKEIGRIGKTD